MKTSLMMTCLLAGLWMGSATANDAIRLTPEQRAELQARCAENPERCEQIRDRLSEAKARCDANPEACEARKAQMKDRVQAAREACAADPAACAERREAIRDRMMERRANP